MKICIKLLMFLFAATVFSCKEDEEKRPSFEFMNRDATGEIANVSWSYEDGLAVIFKTVNNVTQVSVSLTQKQDKEGCDMGLPVGKWIFFGVPDAVGLYKLSSTKDDKYEVQLNDGNRLENIATEGAIEILSISNTKVSGRLDVKYDNQNYINGNFKVSICP